MRRLFDVAIRQSPFVMYKRCRTRRTHGDVVSPAQLSPCSTSQEQRPSVGHTVEALYISLLEQTQKFSRPQGQVKFVSGPGPKTLSQRSSKKISLVFVHSKSSCSSLAEDNGVHASPRRDTNMSRWTDEATGLKGLIGFSPIEMMSRSKLSHT